MSVFSDERTLEAPRLELADGPKIHACNVMNGIELLDKIGDGCIPVCFFDPQYRGVYDHLDMGNEAESECPGRLSMEDMDLTTIRMFAAGIERVLMPSGYLFLWMDKFSLCGEHKAWLEGSALETVDLIVWDKMKMGLGYRTRRMCEYLLVLQKPPKRAKGTWTSRTIRDVYPEKASAGTKHLAHAKPVRLQEELIRATTNPRDVVLDPAAGTYSVFAACRSTGRTFLGCDIVNRHAMGLAKGQEVLA